MNKRQRGGDGDPCSGYKKVNNWDGGNEGIILKANETFPRGALGARAIRLYYDSSSQNPKLSRIHKDELFNLTHLAMWTYNLKEDTNFDNVNLLRAKYVKMPTDSYFYVTFQAFSPQGFPSTFQTKILYYFPHPCKKIEFIFVRIIPDDFDSDDFSDNSKTYRPSVGHPKDRDYRKRLETQINDPHSQLPVYLSEYALIHYILVDLHVSTARHDIQSLKVVKPVECVTKKTTYLLTFQASLCDEFYPCTSFISLAWFCFVCLSPTYS
ncbi:uncharacterized protein LOC141668467 [Apium graveolens]|uniref:uncharacterized protein LOC141668467 n=1 Tax=Apium graveolens TaxID=4045 RepID=UPI003D7BE972